MQEVNRTQVSEFILLGFSDRSEVEMPLFLVFLLIYLLTLTGNLGMIVLIQTDSLLQSPMYFFLSNLSFIDICYSSIIIPRLLYDLFTDRKVISYNACATQMWLFTLYATTECYLLAAMAYDRFVAICNPLFYPIAMAKKVCLQLVAGCYLAGLVNAIVHASGTFRLSFCGPNEISSFFCDIPPLLRLSCSDNYVSKVVLFVLSTFVVVANAVIVLFSYTYIISTILRMRSSTGRRKTFSTCASHLTAIVLYYGSLTFMYVQPGGLEAVEQDKIVSVFYTIVIPMLNPIIYSLRNEEVKKALKKRLSKKIFLKQPKQ
ncbi:olfactory receptor 9I1-like [Rhineura floridana]|uniref:olfactory receptor 9I1-like n=1 Tax=Rhineura floridana TaxID=261503 RepID=UPI002AC88185|nr:olfactory receptor 9I1-like [Rhineura floridana]XP_061465577.1 olfactory receptor 9I1-like [Rhineura floridana]